MRKFSEQEYQQFRIRAYPQLSRIPETFGFHRLCFELGFVTGYILFYLSKDVKGSILATFLVMLVMNHFLKKDPKFFQIRGKAKLVHRSSQGFYRNFTTPKKRIQTVEFTP